MTGPVFSRWWGDPAESLDEIRAMRKRIEEAEKRAREVELRRKKRRIRKLVRLAKARELKGQR